MLAIPLESAEVVILPVEAMVILRRRLALICHDFVVVR